MRVIEMTGKPELWKKIGLRGTPPLLFKAAHSRKTAFLEGVARPDKLDRALGAVRQAPPEERKKQIQKEPQ